MLENKLLEIACENFIKWNNALKSGDPEKVAKLYTNDSVFLPTFSGEIKIGRSGAEEYFKHFLEQNPTSEVVEEKARRLGPESYLHGGMYNFEVGPKNKRETIEARFSFVWILDNKGEWKILHHHSSPRQKEK